MERRARFKLKLFFFNFFLAFSLIQCQQEIIEEEREVYISDFSTGNLTGIAGGGLFDFNGIDLLGPFNNDGFTLTLDNLPSHRILTVYVELYIHDSWDGNGFEPDGTDLWFITMDDQLVFETSFSNAPCEPPYCLLQSYPDPHHSTNLPRTGAFRTDLPGLCHLQDNPNGTTLYRIEKRIGHKESSVNISFQDILVQPNSPNPLCDESWSVGEIRINTISVN